MACANDDRVVFRIETGSGFITIALAPSACL
jgi:hypothetical protein